MEASAWPDGEDEGVGVSGNSIGTPPAATWTLRDTMGRCIPRWRVPCPGVADVVAALADDVVYARLVARAASRADQLREVGARVLGALATTPAVDIAVAPCAEHMATLASLSRLGGGKEATDKGTDETTDTDKVRRALPAVLHIQSTRYLTMSERRQIQALVEAAGLSLPASGQDLVRIVV